MTRKPFYRKRAWWGWVGTTISGSIVAYVSVPNPVLGIAAVIGVISAAVASYSVQEVQREIAIKKTETVAALMTMTVRDRIVIDRNGLG
jgi:hypothetical protein